MADLTALADRVREHAADVFTASIDDLVADIRDRAPVETGTLRDSISADVAVNTDTLQATVVADTDYAEYVNDGTAPHIIEPKDANVLAWQENGEWHFSMRVHHPGTEATHFFSEPVDDWPTLLQQAFDAP